MDELTAKPPTGNGSPGESEKISPWSQLDVRSAEVQEIIGRPPHWLVRRGITAFFGVLAAVLGAASVIKYPEVITAPLRLTAIHAPKTLESKITSKLVRLNYENDTYVQQGRVLAWLKSTASHKEVLRLSARIDSMHGWLRGGELQNIREAELDGFGDLGELQPDFQAFEQAWREFLAYLPGGFYRRKREILEQELRYIRLLLDQLKEQQQIRQETYELARKEYQVQKISVEKGYIAPMDFVKAKKVFLAARLPLQQVESAIINNRASQAAKKQQLMDLDRQIAQQESVFLQALNTLKSAIEGWKVNYLLIVPFAGKLIYAGILQENQTLAAGQEVFYIQPDNTHFFGQVAVSQASFGKIREGQQVLVRFSGYPYQQYGSVTGQIAYLSDIPVKDSVFLAKVSFPEGLSTNYGHELPPTNGMTGQAEIITQDMRLLERFYNNIAKQLR